MSRLRPLVAVATLIASTVLASSASATPPGNLPQTNVEPSFGAPLHHQMSTLVRAIMHDSTRLGAGVFFPEAAYVAMKTGAIPYPSNDYEHRLVSFFNLDLATYRQRLFVGARTTLLRVDANAAFAQWIAPGECENKIGYWHVPGVRLVFRRNGAIVSVAVDSLISWRGVWYVVHLGPNPRPVDVGTVDDFAAGPGTPGPAGGC